MRHRAYTLVEVLVALAISLVVLGMVYGLFYNLVFSGSRSNLTGLTRRSFIQKDTKAGIRRLGYRLREAIQLLQPLPGTSATEVRFRDIANVDVRLRHIPQEKRVVSERLVNGTWTLETAPELVPTGKGALPVSFPVDVAGCVSIHYTAISPDCLTVQASIEYEGQVGPLLTMVKLRNSRLAY